MSSSASFEGDATFVGNFTAADNSIVNAQISPSAGIARSKLAQTTEAEYVIPFSSMRIWNAIQTGLPSPSATDDLGFPATQTMGTVSPYIESYDLKTLTQSLYARFQVILPPEYDSGQTVKIRVRGGMKTTIADASCTVDLEVYKQDEDGGVGADICATAAISINALSNGDKEFTITESGLVAGNVLDCRLIVACVDSASGTAVIAEILKVSALLDIRG